MVLYLIGLGLFDEKDISLRGLDVVKSADLVYLEHYTSILGINYQRLSEFYGREVKLADRYLVEQGADELLSAAKSQTVCLLVVGDPFGATTHTDLLLRAHKNGVEVRVVHNVSVLNAVGVVGLELYKFGKTTSIPFWEVGFEPTTPYDVLAKNLEYGLHTLCLLDIKVKEPTRKALATGIEEFQNPRFMTVAQSLDVLLACEDRLGKKIISPDTLVVGVARLGHPDQSIIAGTVEQLKSVDFGGPLHSLIVPGKLHDIEKEALDLWRMD